MIGTRAMITHAPRNECGGLILLTEMTRLTTPDSAEPVALMNRPLRQCGSLILMWWRAMPACDRVNDVNTPIAYSGIRVSTFARVMITRRMDDAESAMIPLEN